MKSTTTLDQYLAVCDHFKLGDLDTEKSHSKTMNLSEDVLHNLPKAVSDLKAVDQAMLQVLEINIPRIFSLSQELKTLMESGGRLFIGGCGATGRLALSLEFLWRENHEGKAWQDGVISFMAGGDVALIKSIENFEDYPDFGKRQLNELGIKDGDLFIGVTEGGETPFVIGATEEAKRFCSPYFMYCNPDDVLIKKVERSKRVLQDPNIRKINLSTGPMALSGSTRMQASTILMAFIGFAMWGIGKSEEVIRKRVESFTDLWDQINLSFLEKLIEKETEIYDKGEFLNYKSSTSLGMAILTDTTERSPTFSLPPFENFDDQVTHPSLSYLILKDCENVEKAWKNLLHREPRTLEWEEIDGIASRKRLMGFDISLEGEEKRKGVIDFTLHDFVIDKESDVISFQCGKAKGEIPIKDLSSYEYHLILKMTLNILSTSIMGRVGRYLGNVMTWVKPSNNKLIDRSIRYMDQLLKKDGINLSYEELATALFETMEKSDDHRPIVYEAIQAIKK